MTDITSDDPGRDPMSRVRALCSQGSNVSVESDIAPKLYLRTGMQMIRMATIYYEEGNLESALILFVKYITIFVEKLPQHPNYKTVCQVDMQSINRKLRSALPIAEKLKKTLLTRFSDEERERQEVERKQREELEKELARLQFENDQKLWAEQREAQERLVAEQEARLRELTVQERERVEKGGNKDDDRVGVVVPFALPVSNGEERPSTLLSNLVNDEIQPPRYDDLPSVPSRELKKNLLSVLDDTKTPSIDRSNKPAFDLSPGVSDTPSGLRTVVVPTILMYHFLGIAQENTDKNVETCGILSGKLASNAFEVTHLLIPKQNGTSDTCNTQNEEEFFDFQEKNNLFTLGWIHTHPSQTAFLSSVDMHTHCSYQLMLPEAIAIVCSPKFEETGIFMLSQDRGLPMISKCRESGFHHHPTVPPLFETCKHVQLDDVKSIAMEDFRNK